MHIYIYNIQSLGFSLASDYRRVAPTIINSDIFNGSVVQFYPNLADHPSQ